MLDETDVVMPELQPQEVVQEQPKEEPKEQAKPKESDKDLNNRILRERTEAAERRAQDIERRNFELERILREQTQPVQKQQPVDDDDLPLDDDIYVDGKQFKKYVKGLKQELKETKKQFEQQQQQSSLEMAERTLRAQFSDFDSIVTEDNLKKLASQEPVLFRSIMANQNIADRGHSAYKMIKSSGILSDQYAAVDKKIEDNKSKPRSAANAGPQSAETPLTRVGDYDRRILTEERKQQLRRQVEEARRNKA